MAREMSGTCGTRRDMSRLSRCGAGQGDIPPKGGVPPVPTEAGTALAVLADRVRRLCPDHRDPERFHLDKSEIVNDLKRMAREAR